MKLTIAYVTFRQHPRFEWFAASLRREILATPDVSSSDLQVVVIDGRLWHDEGRAASMRLAAAGRIEFEHYSPKPSPWQGPSRQTSKDYFCASSVRNTAFAYARGPHVAFVDDLSVLLPGWLASHMAAAAGGYVLAGTTCKNKNIRVDEVGNILYYDHFPPGQDSRLKMAGVAEGGLVTCGGGSLFGGTFSVSLEAALSCNGQDEICDTIGGEDYDFGMRLERAGCAIKITNACGTFEDEDGHHAESPMVRLDKPCPGPDGPYSSNYLLNKLLRERTRTWTIGNEYILRDVRDTVLAGGSFPEVAPGQKHWVDQQPLEAM